MMRTSSENTINNEELVLNVIIEYLDDNKAFRLNDILPFISSRFAATSKNINMDGIKKILNSLIKKKVVVEGSKLTRDSVLDNQNRFELYSFIKRNPGLYFNSIIERTHVSKYVVYTHLQVLMKFGLIKSEKIDNNVIYFDSSLPLEVVMPIHFASKKKTKKIMSYLKENNIGVTKTQISNDLGIHLTTTEKYLEILVKYDYIIKEKISGKMLYFSLN